MTRYLIRNRETAGDENATCYFPLLDRIADGYFALADTEKELYEWFIRVLQDDGHIMDPQSLSSYQLALSLRSAAPRVEAHYQYYHSAVEPAIKGHMGVSCSVWALFDGLQYCTPSFEVSQGVAQKNLLDQSNDELFRGIS